MEAVASFQIACCAVFIRGVYLQTDEGVLDITELPVRKWTQDYKDFLEGLIKPDVPGQPALLVDYHEHHSGANVHFSLQVNESRLVDAMGGGLIAKFKLTNKMSTGGGGCHKHAVLHADNVCCCKCCST